MQPMIWLQFVLDHLIVAFTTNEPNLICLGL